MALRPCAACTQQRRRAGHQVRSKPFQLDVCCSLPWTAVHQLALHAPQQADAEPAAPRDPLQVAHAAAPCLSRPACWRRKVLTNAGPASKNETTRGALGRAPPAHSSPVGWFGGKRPAGAAGRASGRRCDERVRGAGAIECVSSVACLVLRAGTRIGGGERGRGAAGAGGLAGPGRPPHAERPHIPSRAARRRGPLAAPPPASKRPRAQELHSGGPCRPEAPSGEGGPRAGPLKRPQRRRGSACSQGPAQSRYFSTVCTSVPLGTAPARHRGGGGWGVRLRGWRVRMGWGEGFAGWQAGVRASRPHLRLQQRW